MQELLEFSTPVIKEIMISIVFPSIHFNYQCIFFVRSIANFEGKLAQRNLFLSQNHLHSPRGDIGDRIENFPELLSSLSSVQMYAF
jgi:hypothetical protein